MCANLIPALKAVHARGAFSLRCCGSGSQVKSLWTCFPCWFALWIWTSGLVCLQVWLVPCCSCCPVPFTFCGPCLTCCCCLKRLATCMPSRHDEGGKSSLRSVACEPAFLVLLIALLNLWVTCPASVPVGLALLLRLWALCLRPPKLRHLPARSGLGLETRDQIASCSALCPGVISPFWCHLVWPWPFFSCLDCWLLG